MTAPRLVLVPADPNRNIAVITAGPWPSSGTALGRVRIDWECNVTGASRWAYWNLEDLTPPEAVSACPA